jgi:predicted ATPase/transcriptional regulator with XRE-family HTH domain
MGSNAFQSKGLPVYTLLSFRYNWCEYAAQPCGQKTAQRHHRNRAVCFRGHSAVDLTFGTWVKRRRKALDLTQHELARQVGCSASAIFKIESDERRPSRQIAELLAQILEIPDDQHDLFIKVARQEKMADRLEAIPRYSEPAPFIQIQGGQALASNPSQTSLPHSLTSLVGREHEMRAIIQQIQEPACRLLTLTGPGGVGKTRLALEVAHRLHSTYEYRACFVSLVGTSAPEFIIPALADALGFAFSGMGEPKKQLFNFLREKQILLVLDNLEHLLTGIEFLAELLEQAPGVKLLTTSREQLNLRAEWVFDVQGLPVPSDMDLADLASSSAATLFLQRARQSKVDFNPTQDDLRAIKRICEQVEGLPLGLELAASWARALSCEEIVQEIERSIDFLTATARDVPQRHRSIRAVFDSSWSLLPNKEQSAMRGLSVFRGGFTREAAEAVAGATLPILLALKDKSLIRISQPARYDLHELIRQYAYEQLVMSGELDSTCDRHLDFYLAMAEESISKLRGAEQLLWLNSLEQDHDNLRAALEWSLRYEKEASKPSHGAGQGSPKSLRLAGALYQFWKMRIHWVEGRKWLQRALAQSSQFPNSPERFRALDAATLLAAEQADTRAARELAEESLALAHDLDDSHSIAQALSTLGQVLWRQKDFAVARNHCGQALAQFRELEDKIGMGDALKALARIAMNQNDLETAQACLEESLALFRELEDRIEFSAVSSDLGLLAYLHNDFPAARAYLERSLALFRKAQSTSGIEMSLNRLGDIARCENNYDEAGKCYTECLKVFQESGDKDEIPSLLHNLGYVAIHYSDFTRALDLFKKGLEMHIETGNQAGIAECLAGIAAVLSSQGQVQRGARLFGAAEIIREKAGAILWPANRMEYERSLALLRDALEGSALAAAWAAGGAMPSQQVITEALSAS